MPNGIVDLVMPFLALAAFAVTAQTPAEFDFKRIYKVGDTAIYSAQMTGMGTVTGELQTTVVSLTPNGATVKYVGRNFAIAEMPGDMPIPDLTTKVGPEGMPNGATIRNGQEFFVFLGAAGMVPSKKAKVGDEVTVHWQNDPKDVAFDGTGRILELNKEAKTLTVQWTMTMTPSYTPPAKWKLKSVYSTDDFSLKSSEGTFELGAVVQIKFARKK